MTLDAMHLVLYALYTEYQKDLPDMEAVSSEALGIDDAVFNVAAKKLQNERYITGAEFKYVDQLRYPIFVHMDNVMPTEKALEYVARDLGITERTGEERTRHLIKKFAGYSWDGLSDFAAKVLVEISKQIIK